MGISYCDVIGCNGLATWVRLSDLDEGGQDFLCNGCWNQLRHGKPEQAKLEQAKLYTPFDQHPDESDVFPNFRLRTQVVSTTLGHIA